MGMCPAQDSHEYRTSCCGKLLLEGSGEGWCEDCNQEYAGILWCSRCNGIGLQLYDRGFEDGAEDARERVEEWYSPQPYRE